MEIERDRTVVKRGLKLLIGKVILGAIAAAAAMALMRVLGTGEIIVALFIGLVPGLAERSLKKLVAGALLGAIGYLAGARVGALVAKSASGVPLGHWAVTGAFIGVTAGFSRKPAQWFSFRIVVWSLGAVYGFLLGFIFGIVGDIAGFLTVPAHFLGLFYYMREVSLLCAGVFVSLAAAIASILSALVDNALWRVARSVEKLGG